MTLLKDKPKSILLNAGDNYEGTMWYTIGKWNITQEFMNKLPIDASTLGNHEFDDGIEGIVPYIKAVNHPIVVSNIDDSLEPDIQGLYTKSTIIERDGKKIGVIGVTTTECDRLSNTGKLKFHKESSSVNAEAERLVKEENVFTIIVLSHSGYDVDKIIAQNASEKISLIVGGHSHTFLYTGDNPPGPDVVSGPYPTIIPSKNGHNVLITQASSFSKYLGNITVFIDKDGEIVEHSGAPIFLDTSFPQDEAINADLNVWKKIVDAQEDNVIGSSLVLLSYTHCYTKECTMGNFLADAMVYQYTKSAPEGWWTEAAIGLIHAISIRTGIDAGNITYNEMHMCQPFGNTIDFGQLEGKYIQKLMESTVKENRYESTYSTALFQVSGLKLEYDLTKSEGFKVSIKARCANCTIPFYEDLLPEKLYNIALPSFLISGGFPIISDNLKNHKIGNVDIDNLKDYLAHRSPVFEEENGRIIIKTGDVERKRNRTY